MPRSTCHLLTSDVVGGCQQAEDCNDELHGRRHGQDWILFLSFSLWNANERRLYVGHVDDTVAPFGFCDGKQVSRNPCVSFVGFPFVNRNSFSLSLSLSLSVSVSLALRELKTARDANGCSSDFRLNAFGCSCHTATVTPTATSTLTATPAAMLAIVSYADNDDAWGCPMLPPAETIEIIMIYETSGTQIPLIS